MDDAPDQGARDGEREVTRPFGIPVVRFAL
jgi:hypothetical protein